MTVSGLAADQAWRTEFFEPCTESSNRNHLHMKRNVLKTNLDLFRRQFGKAKEFSSKLQENLGLALVRVVFCPYVLVSLASHTEPVYNLYTKMHSGSILEREHFHQVSSVFQWREAHGHAMGCPAREKTVCVVPCDWTRLNQLLFQVPKIQTTNINKACVRAMSGDMPPKWGRLYMVQYLYFRVLKFPLNDWFVQPLRFFSLGPG